MVQRTSQRGGKVAQDPLICRERTTDGTETTAHIAEIDEFTLGARISLTGGSSHTMVDHGTGRPDIVTLD